MMRSIRVTLLALLGFTMLVGSAKAQGGADKEGAKSCDKAAKILAKGHPDKKESWAYGVIARCSGGAAALAGAWAPPPTDSTQLHDLAAASVDLADRRILDAVLGTVQDVQATQPTRRVAINVLLSQYSPELRMGTAGWNDPERFGTGRLTDFYQVPGEQPVTAADRQRIIGAFRGLAASDPDLKIRAVAMRIAADLGGSQPRAQAYPTVRSRR